MLLTTLTVTLFVDSAYDVTKEWQKRVCSKVLGKYPYFGEPRPFFLSRAEALRRQIGLIWFGDSHVTFLLTRFFRIYKRHEF